jgi:BCD family chlorophyll transporter-like MFS transporter
MQFGGLAFMPFALLLLAEGGRRAAHRRPVRRGDRLPARRCRLHTTQTAGLALATDIAPKMSRPRVVALLFVVLQLSMLGSALVFGLPADRTSVRCALIR